MAGGSLTLGLAQQEVNMGIGFNPLDRPFDWEHVIATGQVKTGPGMLHAITINRGDPAAGRVITIYDGVGVTANIIAIIALDTALFVIPQTLIYDCGFLAGLYVAFDGDVTLADLTVSYK
jgi:hypothetical protein